MTERYLKVTAREEGRWRGGVQHFGTKFYAEGYLDQGQVDLILAEKTFVSAEWVVSVPEGAVVVGGQSATAPQSNEPAAGNKVEPMKSAPRKAAEAIDLIGKLVTADEVTAFVMGDTRPTVQEAASKRIEELALG